jgi:hypothetical protein
LADGIDQRLGASTIKPHVGINVESRERACYPIASVQCQRLRRLVNLNHSNVRGGSSGN